MKFSTATTEEMKIFSKIPIEEKNNENKMFSKMLSNLSEV